jgi:hypothetical protein
MLADERFDQVRAGLLTLADVDPAHVDRHRLVAGIGSIIRRDPAARAELTAVVALAVSTVSAHYDAHSDATAALWLDFCRNYHQRMAG